MWRCSYEYNSAKLHSKILAFCRPTARNRRRLSFQWTLRSQQYICNKIINKTRWISALNHGERRRTLFSNHLSSESVDHITDINHIVLHEAQLSQRYRASAVVSWLRRSRSFKITDVGSNRKPYLSVYLSIYKAIQNCAISSTAADRIVVRLYMWTG